MMCNVLLVCCPQWEHRVAMGNNKPWNEAFAASMSVVSTSPYHHETGIFYMKMILESLAFRWHVWITDRISPKLIIVISDKMAKIIKMYKENIPWILFMLVNLLPCLCGFFTEKGAVISRFIWLVTTWYFPVGNNCEAAQKQSSFIRRLLQYRLSIQTPFVRNSGILVCL